MCVSRAHINRTHKILSINFYFFGLGRKKDDRSCQLNKFGKKMRKLDKRYRFDMGPINHKRTAKISLWMGALSSSSRFLSPLLCYDYEWIRGESKLPQTSLPMILPSTCKKHVHRRKQQRVEHTNKLKTGV